MTQSLPGPRGSLASHRRQSQAPHRRHGSNGTRGSGSRKTKGGGGGAIVQAASSCEGGGRPGAGRRGLDKAGVESGAGSNSSSSSGSGRHPRSQERASRYEEGGSRAMRSNGGQRGSKSNRAGAARGAAGCSEAWGVTTTAAAARTSADRVHGGSGGGLGRGGRNSNSPEVWAWAGAGDGAARGNAMLSAYGLQTDRLNPTCPRGVPGNSAARHGRWQRDKDGGGARKVGSASSAGNGGDQDKGGGVEGGAGADQRRGSGSGSGCGRAGDKLTSRNDRASPGQNGFRGGKGRNKRPSVAPRGASTSTSDTRGQPAGDAAAEGCCGPQASASVAASPGDLGEDHLFLTKPRSREHTLEDALIHPRGSTASAHKSGSSALPPAATSGQVALLSMDGRGGSAAPPYRPKPTNLAAPASASYAPVLPDLGTGMGTGTAGVGGTVAASEADHGYGGSFGEGDGGGGTGDQNTPPVSRQRSYSHHSPWQARKNPRGFPGGRVGRHHNSRHHSHPHERSLLEERPTSGSTTSRLGSCFSSESRERASTVDSTSVCESESWTGVPPTVAAASGNPVGGDNNPNGSGRPSSGNAAAPSSSRPTGVVVAKVGMSGRRKAGDLNPFDRLLRPHNQGGEGSFSTAVAAKVATAAASQPTVPKSELIDHFKMASRPPSRRSSREQVGGDDSAPEPAFCLFSRGMGGGGGRARGAGEEERSRGRDARQ